MEFNLIDRYGRFYPRRSKFIERKKRKIHPVYRLLRKEITSRNFFSKRSSKFIHSYIISRNQSYIHTLHHIFSSKCINRIDSSLQIRSSPLREREGGRASLSSNLYKSGFIIFRFGGCLSAPNVFRHRMSF